MTTVNSEVKATLDALGDRAKAYLVDKRETSTTWYRKYSDGWVEQGGINAGASGTITFPIAFSNKRYTFLHTKTTDFNMASMGSDSFSAWNKTTTSVTVLADARWTKDWYACGY